MGSRARLAAGVVSTVMIAVACTSGGTSNSTTSAAPGKPHGVLTLLAYTDGYKDLYINGFKTQYPDVTLRTSPEGSGDEAEAKMLAGFNADVVNACVDENALDMVNKGIFQPLDLSRIPDWQSIFPSFKTLPGVMVNGKAYLVPIDAGTAGILYDPTKVSPAPDSWTALFDPRYKGQAAIEDNSTTAIDIGALVNGFADPQAMTSDQLDTVKNYLIAHKDQFRTYWQSDGDIINLFKNHEIAISSGYPSDALNIQRAGGNAKFVLANEGQMLWTCGYGISANAQNVDAAYALLNYYLDWHQELFEVKYWGYGVANSQVLDHASKNLIETAGLAGPSSYSHPIPASPPADRQAWTQAWREVKAA